MFIYEPSPAEPMPLLQAMATVEGWYAKGAVSNRPQRNCNPGDLTFCSETVEAGATHGDPRFAVFPDNATGWEAFRRWMLVPARFDGVGNLVGGYCGATLEKIINRFAPPAENQTNEYLTTVCRLTGLSPLDTVSEAIINEFAAQEA